MRDAGSVTDFQRMRRAQANALVENMPEPGQVRPEKAEPGDLRGIPVIGQGVGGVSPGTSPESAIDRVDRQRERRRRVVIEELGPREPMVAYG
jgi:hypothetical protein